jgi:predicted homoserine dehydrogenase-like protein
VSAILRGLEARAAAGDPIRVGLVGAGYAGRGFAARILRRTPGIELVAIANRTIDQAERAYRQGGVDAPGHVGSAADLDVAIRNHRPVVTDDPTILTDAIGIEAIVEATGEVEFGAGVAVRSIDAGKHLILINAELDSCLGPILKSRADGAGVILTDMAGDQPAVLVDLVDEVRMLGFRATSRASSITSGHPRHRRRSPMPMANGPR